MYFLNRLTLLLIFIFFGCSNHDTDTELFNKKQRALVANLLKQNDSLLKNKYNLSIDESYSKHLQELKKTESADEVLNNSFLSNQKLLNDFAEIGFLEKVKLRIYDPIDKKFEPAHEFSYMLNRKSPYIKFLENISKKNQTINQYYQSLLSGMISPSSTAILIHNINKQDLKDDKIRFIVSLHFLIFNQGKNSSTAFKDTYLEILKISITDLRYLKPPTPEQSQKGIKVIPQKRPDTLPPLKIYIQKEHITVNLDDLKQKLSEMPPDFLDQFSERTKNFIPDNFNQYSNKIYELIPLKNYNEVSKFFKNNRIPPRDFGGVFQFSKLYLNKKGDQALLFVRDTRHRLDSTESLYLLEKKNGKWKIIKSFGISMS